MHALELDFHKSRFTYKGVYAPLAESMSLKINQINFTFETLTNSIFVRKTRYFYGVKSVLPFSKLIIGKCQVFSARSYVYLPGYMQIRNRGGTMCLHPVLIGLRNISISLGPVQRTIQCSAVQRTGFVHSNPLYFTSVHSLALPSLGGRNPSSHHCVTFSDLWISSFFSVFWETCNGKEGIYSAMKFFREQITSTIWIWIWKLQQRRLTIHVIVVL